MSWQLVLTILAGWTVIPALVWALAHELLPELSPSQTTAYNGRIRDRSRRVNDRGRTGTTP